MNSKDTSQFCEYLKYSIYYCFETKISFFIITLIEIIDILTNLIDQIVRIFYYDQTFSSEDSTFNKLKELQELLNKESELKELCK